MGLTETWVWEDRQVFSSEGISCIRAVLVFVCLCVGAVGALLHVRDCVWGLRSVQQTFVRSTVCCWCKYGVCKQAICQYMQ